MACHKKSYYEHVTQTFMKKKKTKIDNRELIKTKV